MSYNFILRGLLLSVIAFFFCIASVDAKATVIPSVDNVVKADFGRERFRGGERDGERGHGYQKRDRERDRDRAGGNRGNEPTGAATGLLFIIANITVIMSLLIKGAVKALPMNDAAKQRLNRFNAVQKKKLRYIHYVANIAALVTVSVHFALSRCVTTELPEAAYAVMLFLCVTGFIISLKSGKGNWKKTIRRIHMHPLAIIALILLILIGHAMLEG